TIDDTAHRFSNGIERPENSAVFNRTGWRLNRVRINSIGAGPALQELLEAVVLERGAVVIAGTIGIAPAMGVNADCKAIGIPNDWAAGIGGFGISFVGMNYVSGVIYRLGDIGAGGGLKSAALGVAVRVGAIVGVIARAAIIGRPRGSVVHTKTSDTNGIVDGRIFPSHTKEAKADVGAASSGRIWEEIEYGVIVAFAVVHGGAVGSVNWVLIFRS